MEHEIWKAILGFKHYEVSNLGNVRSLDCDFLRSNGRTYRRKGKVLNQSEWSDGYLVVQLYENKKRYIKKVHQLVINAFYGETPDGKVIDHINNNKHDNRLKNLQFITNAENLSKDTWRHRKNIALPLGVSQGKNRKNYVSIYNADGQAYYLGTYENPQEASEAYIKARKDFEEKGIIPKRYSIKRHKVINGMKVCSCCGKNLPLSEYYISKGRVQGKCKQCFIKTR